MSEPIADTSGPVVEPIREVSPTRVSEERAVPAEVAVLTRSLESIGPTLRGRPGLRGCGGSGI